MHLFRLRACPESSAFEIEINHLLRRHQKLLERGYFSLIEEVGRATCRPKLAYKKGQLKVITSLLIMTGCSPAFCNTVVWLHSKAAASHRPTAGLAALLILLAFVALSLSQEVCPSVTESTGMISSQSLRSPTVHVFPFEGGALSWVAKLTLFHVINS
jgi:hypothetical protein